MTSKVKFFETSSGSLQEEDGQRSGYPAPLQQKADHNSEDYAIVIQINSNAKIK